MLTSLFSLFYVTEEFHSYTKVEPVCGKGKFGEGVSSAFSPIPTAPTLHWSSIQLQYGTNVNLVY